MHMADGEVCLSQGGFTQVKGNWGVVYKALFKYFIILLDLFHIDLDFFLYYFILNSVKW